MRTLIEDLLAYSKITNVAEGYETVDLNIIIDEIAAFHKEDFEQYKITLERDPLPIITAIPFQIKQLMSNLIDNAVKYRQPGNDGRIQIEYKVIDGKVLQKVTNPFRKYHSIAIKDNGIGFDAIHATKIFEIFQRLSTASGAKGTGIGLAICKKIIQNHNGWIEASGKPGKGATFSIYLPVC
jgi:signal transduction histidine kinase